MPFGRLTPLGRVLVKKLQINGGSLEGGAVNIDGDKGLFTWNAGTIRGVFSILPGATLTTTNSNQKEFGGGAVLNNYGSVSWYSGTFYNYAYDLWMRATINNYSNAVFNVMGDGLIFNTDYNNLIFNNEPGALFVKKAGTNETQVAETSFYNRGEVRAEVGRIGIHTLFLEDKGRITGNGVVGTYHGPVETRGETIIDGGTFVIDTGTFHGIANSSLTTTNGGSIGWSSGTLSGQITVNPNTYFYITGNNTRSFGSTTLFKNHGYVHWVDNGNIHNYAYELWMRSTFQNFGTLSINGGGSFVYDYNPSFFRNEEGGVVRKVGGGINNWNWRVENHGSMQSDSDVLSLNSGGASTGTFATETAGLIRFNGGTHTISGVHFRGPGKIQLENGNLTRAGALYSDETNPGTLEIINGTFDGNGSIEGPMTVDWIYGTIAGVINITPSVVVNCFGPNTKSLYAAVFNNTGTFNWKGSGLINSYAYYDSEPSVFNNLSNGVFNISADGRVFKTDYRVSYFTNHAGGLLLKSDGWGTNTLDSYEYYNAGRIKVDTGTLQSQGLLTLNPGTVFDGDLGLMMLSGETIVKTPLLSSINMALDAGTLRAISGSNNAELVTFAGTAPFDWRGGTIAGVFGVAEGSALTMTGPGDKVLGSGTVFNNRGAVNWHGGKIYNMGYHLDQRATFNNLSNASFNLFADGQVFAYDYNRSFFTNHAGAAIAKLGGEGTNIISHFAIENYGDIVQLTGTLRFTDLLNLYEGSYLAGEGKMYWEGNINLNGFVYANCDIEFNQGTLTGAKATEGYSLGSYGGPGVLTWLNGTLAGGIMIQPDSLVEIAGPAVKSFGTGTVLDNFGTISWKGGGKFYALAYSLVDRVNINNYGSFLLEGDGQVFDYSYNRSFFNVMPGGRLTKTASTGTNILSAFAIINQGEISTDSGAMHFTEHLEAHDGGVFKGNVSQISGDMWWHGTASINAGSFILAGGNLNGGHATNNAALATTSGGTFEWRGGAINGTFSITPGTTFNINGGGKALGSGAVLNNHGNVTWTSGDIHNFAYYLEQVATLNNRSGGVWDIVGDVSFTQEYNPSTFNNQAGAVLRKSGGTGTSSIHWNLNQNGMLDLQRGRFIPVNGFNLASSGLNRFHLGGESPFTQYGQLQRNSLLTFNGALTLLLDDSFVPTNGMQFTLATYSSRAGEFVSPQLPALPPQSRWQLTYGPNALVAEVAPVTAIQNVSMLPGGTFQLNALGKAGSAAILEGSIDLQTWIPITTNSPFTGSFVFSDADPAATNKFYRVLVLD